MARELDRCALIERSVTKKYRKEIWNGFIKAVKEYRLINEGDKIAVCISGGKDSMLMAVLFKLLHKYSEIPFDMEFLVMNPGYNERNLKKIKENAQILNIPITVFESDIFDVTEKITESPCYLCARMRRGHLYKYAQQLGCNKIALGHHFDDVIETTLLNIFYGSQIGTMMPKLHSTNFPGMELIRPLYMVRENDIKRWVNYNGLTFLNCACAFTKAANEQNEHEALSKRKEMKELISQFRKINPNVEMSIFKSVHNVNLETIIGYRKGDETHNFLAHYDK